MPTTCSTIFARRSKPPELALNHGPHTSFAAILAAIAPHVPGIRAMVLLADEDAMPEVALAPGQDLLCHETLLAARDGDFAWPKLNEGMSGPKQEARRSDRRAG